MKRARAGLFGLLAAMTTALAAEPVTLNLKEADIQTLITLVSEVTGRNFIVDPRVKAKVTVVSARPIERNELYQVFQSVLQIHGFATVPMGKNVKIVPEVSARQDAVPTFGDIPADRGDEMVTRVIAVQNVSAAQLVPVLRPLVAQQSHLAAVPGSNLLIITDRAENIRRILDIVRRVDLETRDEVEVIRLQHAAAGEIVRILSALEGTTTKTSDAGGGPTRMIADERTNSVMLSGEPQNRLRLRALIGHLDTPLETGGNTQVVYLRYAKAKDLAQILNGMGASIAADPKAAPAAAGKATFNIQADDATNSLILSGPPDVQRALLGVVRQLDVRRAQVLVEAVIAEVSFDKTRELGVQWIFEGSSTNNPVGLINFSANPGASILNLLSTPPTFRADGLAIGGARATAGSARYGALLNALAGDSNTNILSTPSLVTLDNEEAEIVIAQNVPFITGQYSNTGTGSTTTPTNPFQTIQRQDVGLILKVKPQVNEGDAVRLNITQEVSSLSPSTAGAADIITNKRAIKTSVLVDDGKIVVLGGLVDDTLSETEQRVPLLGDIPVLGWLFKYSRTTKVKRNLMVFIHPTILRDTALGMNTASAKYSLMRAEQLGVRADGVRFLPDADSPLLPELDEFLKLPPPYREPGGPAAQAIPTDEPPAMPADVHKP